MATGFVLINIDPDKEPFHFFIIENGNGRTSLSRTLKSMEEKNLIIKNPIRKTTQCANSSYALRKKMRSFQLLC